MDELLSLLSKEEIIETEEKIEKALAKSIEDRKTAKEELMKAIEEKQILLEEENLNVSDKQKTKTLTSDTGIKTKSTDAKRSSITVIIHNKTKNKKTFRLITFLLIFS